MEDVTLSFFRYPGGKSKLSHMILPRIASVLESDQSLEYREPFFGGGSIGLKMLDLSDNQLWINDYDFGIHCVWNSVINKPDDLKNLIMGFTPSVDEFYRMKSVLLTNDRHHLTDDEKVEYGFYKIAIHQTSYSGLGTKSGGPLGGKEQKSKYDIACRWSPEYMCKKIDMYHKKFARKTLRESTCTCSDFSRLILDTDAKAFIYLDPPYYVKGNELYQCGFDEEDHIRLAHHLRETQHKWLLSYDHCEEIEKLYSWANVEYVSKVNYSINTSRNKQELLISNF